MNFKILLEQHVVFIKFLKLLSFEKMIIYDYSSMAFLAKNRLRLHWKHYNNAVDQKYQVICSFEFLPLHSRDGLYWTYWIYLNKHKLEHSFAIHRNWEKEINSIWNILLYYEPLTVSLTTYFTNSPWHKQIQLLFE